jgi:hypothetical protein
VNFVASLVSRTSVSWMAGQEGCVEEVSVGLVRCIGTGIDRSSGSHGSKMHPGGAKVGHQKEQVRGSRAGTT